MTRTARTRTLALFTILLAAGTTGCDAILGPRDNNILRDQLAQSEEVWAQRGVSDYRIDVVRGPLYAAAYRTVTLEIVGGQIVSGTYADDGTPLDAADLAVHQTVPEMFAFIREALDRRAPAIAVRYDDAYGFPNLIQVDFDTTRFGDDVHIQILEFTPLTP